MLIESFAVDDFVPPTTTVTLDGSYNEATGWYYGKPPVATFTAADDVSGVREIIVWYKTLTEVVWYKSFSGQTCDRDKCSIQPGDKVTLDKETGFHKGQVIVKYSAVDNAGNAENPQKLSILVDTQLPDVYITKIKTESIENIPIGSQCKDAKNKNCVIINAKFNEMVTFEMLGSDTVSGMDSIYYRVLQSRGPDQGWQVLDETSFPLSLNLKFDKSDIYKVQLKARDIAGNESDIKEFLVKVLPPESSDIAKQPIPVPVKEPEKVKETQITVSNRSIVDQLGSALLNPAVGQAVLIQSDLRNNLQNQQAFAYIVQIKDSDGFTVMLSWLTGTLLPGQTFTAAQSWFPEKEGNYIVETFVWESISKPAPLSQLLWSEVTVAS